MQETEVCSGPAIKEGDEDKHPEGTGSKLWHIILIALIAIAFTAAFLTLYGALNNLIWFDNDFVAANRWTIPVGVMIFSLAVGLCQKYLHAPNEINGSFVESLKGEGAEINYRTFPGAFLSSIFSLLSGASIGPEGTIAVLVGDIASFTRQKLKFAVHSAGDALGFDVAAMASAFNGIIGSVLFTGIFATEFQVGGKKNALRFLTWNLLAGAIGYMFYAAIGLPAFAQAIPFSPIGDLHLVYILDAFLLGVLGALIAIFMGISMKGAGKLFDRVFGEKIMLRILGAGAIIAVVCYIFPEVMFSGEIQVRTLIDNPALFGVAMLLLFALLKILLLAVSFKGGYLGGPIFPILFSSTMIGLALSLVFPGVPVSILVLCIEVAAITLALGAPLTAILLVAVVGAADPHTVALLALSAVTAMILMQALTRFREKRGAGGEEAPGE
ncbi:H+/Cl- antiporter ClcA [Methanolinea mesophila]|uniref:chloride channel protein n=1 Tax=Methanolinea mesophila TaxID=547055 RepID=UPI001AEB6F87|nr:chloride channel protein [Methanolinea mesophila]MBP1929021.1 H+/Cl- antiporter ClcA [Methanolinea mesophila]